MFSAVFTWSFIAREIAVVDALGFAVGQMQTSMKPGVFIILLLKVGMILAALQALKLIATEMESSKKESGQRQRKG